MALELERFLVHEAVRPQFYFSLKETLRQHNPGSFRSAILDFLALPEASLDYGFSRPLQKDAHAQGDLQASVAFLQSQPVQAELDQAISTAMLSSMDVERKHFQDKCFERGQSKIRSINRCSRNTMIRTYRLERRTWQQRREHLQRRWDKEKYVNLRSVAVARHPEWLPRPRGALHWETDVSAKDRRQIVFAGDPEALSAYIEQNRAELQTEAAQRRLHAKIALERAAHSRLPVSNAEWLQWVDENEAEFHKFLRESTETRRSLSSRIFVSNDARKY